MPKRSAPYTTSAELEQVLDSLHGPLALRDRAIILLTHTMALRAKEVAMLTIGDVLNSRGELRRTVFLTPCHTKGGQPRQAYLTNPRARQAMIDYLDSIRHKDPDRRLFLSRSMAPMDRVCMRVCIRDIYLRAGVDATSHSGRKTLATRIYEETNDVYLVQQLLGHRWITTTTAYIKHNPDRLMAVIAKL